MQNSEITIFEHYRPAELHEGNIWYINYYAINPHTNKLHEKRIKYNKIKSITERRKQAKKVIVEINKKLQSGWNPFLENSAHKSFTTLNNCLNTFLESKRKELRPNSMRSYDSFTKIFREWMEQNGLTDHYTINFNQNHASNYLQYVETIIETNNTYNNYLRSIKVIFNWMVEKQYISSNPFERFTFKKRQNKTRIIIPADSRDKIKNELEGNNDYLFGLSLLVFGSLLRPNEITFLKKGNFNFEKQIIIIPPEVSKNGKLRVATIPDKNMEAIERIVNGRKELEYIFGRPDNMTKQQCPRNYSKMWARLRNKMKLPKEMKLYSLRDSGIVQLLQDGISPHDVMRLADHSDLSITTKYLPYAGLGGNETIKTKSSGF